MKRHVVLLLMILAFIAGIAVYRAAVYTPAEQLATSLIDVGWPNAMDSEIVFVSELGDPAEPRDDVPDVNEPSPPTPETFDAEVEPPTDATFDAVPDGSRVRVRSGEGLNLEADEIRLNALRAAGLVSDNPIPEFLRGRDLPPLATGEKVVTIPVPVDNWVDLGWGDQVRVEFEQAFNGRGVNFNAGLEGNFRLKVCDGEIYALPQFAPETGDTVPVCLKLTTKAARELLAIRKNPGTYTVTVTHKFEPVITTITTTAPPASRAASDITFSHEPLPIAPHDEFDVLPHAGTDVPELPVIEPSDAGTVYELKPGGEYVVTMGDPLLLEAALPIIRVTGFDQKIIRVTADSPRRLRVLGINPGGTAIKVTLDKGVFPPFNVTLTVVPSADSALAEEHAMAVQQERLLRSKAKHDTAKLVLQELYPDADLRLVWVGEAILLRGTVSSEEEKADITDIATQFAPKVLNQLHVDSPAQPRPRPMESSAPQPGPVPPQSRFHVRPEQRVVVLVLADPAQLKSLKVGDRVDVHRVREVRRGDKVEVEERIMATNATVFQVHVSDNGNLLSLIVPPEVANQLIEADTSTLQILPHPADPTRELPIVVTNSTEELLKLKPGDRVNVLRVTRPPLPASLSAVTEELVVGAAPLVRVDISPERVVVLELTRDQEVAVVQSGEQPLTIQRPPTPQQSAMIAGLAQEPASVRRDSLRNDIRALHDEVRKLIALLEQRLGNQSPGHESGPGAAPYGTPGPVDPAQPAVPADAAQPDPAGTPGTPADAQPTAEPQPADQPERTSQPSAQLRDLLWQQLGLRVSRVASNTRAFAGLPYKGGLLIEDVRPGSPMADTGVRKGDVLVGFNLWEVLTEENLRYVLDHPSTHGEQPIKIYLLRNRETVYGHVRIDRQPDATNTTPAAPSAGAIIQREFADAAPLDPDSAATPSSPTARPHPDFVNNWGRAMLRGQFRIAMGIVHDAYRDDPDNPLYEQYVHQTRTALAARSFKQPLTVAVLADWCGPCRQMQPLLRRLQDTTGDIIFLDADIDRDLVEQFGIHAVPSFARVIDGEKLDEIVGVASEDALRRFMRQTDDPPPDPPQTHRPDLRLFPVEGFTIHVPAAGAIRRGVTDAFPAFESSKTDRVFSFYVGFTR